MLMLRKEILISLAFLLLTLPSSIIFAANLSGDLNPWHTLALTFDGPETSETFPSTFLNNKLTVTFTLESESFEVPGYFAGDGNSSRSHATSGNKWRVKFTPHKVGKWQYTAEFLQGENVSIHNTKSKKFLLKDGTGTFEITKPNKVLSPDDFRNHGRLVYVNKHHLQFEGSKKYFLKSGTGSPENLLAFDGFDGTWDAAKCPEFPELGDDQLHHYLPHRKDWTSTDPYWTNTEGRDNKGIIGAVNYLASKSVNSFYFMTLTYPGDGCDIWPWTGPENRTTFDVSKLAQWDLLFSHMQQKGIHLHMFLNETENENIFELQDGAEFSDLRKLYYRELIARFGHHLALTWNLGEETGWTDEKGKESGIANTLAQQKAFIHYIDELDAYDHPMKIHEIDIVEIYPPLLGDTNFDGPTLQRHSDYNKFVKHFIDLSKSSGRPWVVSMDEPLGWEFGLKPDAEDPTHDIPRKEVLWGTYMAGGSGVEWYFGWQNNAPTSDLSSEDLTVRSNMWEQSAIAHDFFQTYLPFSEMTADNNLVKGDKDYVFYQENIVYLVYLKQGGKHALDLTKASGKFNIYWFNPRFGGELLKSNVKSVEGGKLISLGVPPSAPQKDWAVLLKRD